VNRDNPAIQFYQKFGFEIIDKEDIDIGNGFLMEDYVMKWSFNIDA
jgi:ribosomal protein S18 acetylase RimI-like enzyme